MTNRTDNFNRADNVSSLGTPSDGGSAWVAQAGTWGIISNTAYISDSSSGLSIQEIATLESSVSDVDIQVTFSTVGNDAGLVARFADTSNYLLFIWTGGGTGLSIYKDVAGTLTQLGNTAYTAANGDILKFSVKGSTLNAYVNGTLKLGPITESAGSTNTKHGMRAFSGATHDLTRFDDFSITANNVASGKLFTPSNLDGIGAGGPFFSDRLAG